MTARPKDNESDERIQHTGDETLRHPGEESLGQTPSVQTPELAAERYILLVEQLAEERGHRWGWKAHVAKQLGVSPAYVSMLSSGERRGVGIDAVEKAIKRLRIDRSYFYGPHTGDPHYRDFQSAAGVPDLADRHSALSDFLSSSVGQGVKPYELAILRGTTFDEGTPTARWYELLLTAIREGAPPADAAASAGVTGAAEDRARARGMKPSKKR